MRKPELGAGIGKKGSGKTVETNKEIQGYVRGNNFTDFVPRKVLILDTNDEFTDVRPLSLSSIHKFSAQSTIEARRVRPYRESDGRNMSLKELQDAMLKMLEFYRDGLFLAEDINLFVSDSLPSDLVGRICTQRHKGVDMILHFQSIGRITPKIWGNLNWLRFHSSLDTVEDHKEKFPARVEIMKIVEAMVNNETERGNQYFKVHANFDKVKILGAYSQRMLDDAIVRYIEENYNYCVKPIMNKVDIRSGSNKKVTPQEAVARVRASLYHKYYQNSPKVNYVPR